VIAFTGGYHGLGYGALEVTGIRWFHEPFQQHLRDFTSTGFPILTAIDARLEGKRDTGWTDPVSRTVRALFGSHRGANRQTIRQRPIRCLVVEPCQGRGGEVVPPLDFLRMLRQVCDTYKILLMFDEIYTGFNRTGTLFASDRFGVYPDSSAWKRTLPQDSALGLRRAGRDDGRMATLSR
jgi:4-aminobutyrate aminotransferase-like enzyme